MTASPSDVTTIKVSKALRDRIAAGATHRREPVQRFLENVLDDYDRHQRLAAVAAAMGDADDDTLREWRAETAIWASLDDDIEGAQ